MSRKSTAIVQVATSIAATEISFGLFGLCCRFGIIRPGFARIAATGPQQADDGSNAEAAGIPENILASHVDTPVSPSEVGNDYTAAGTVGGVQQDVPSSISGTIAFIASRRESLIGDIETMLSTNRSLLRKGLRPTG